MSLVPPELTSGYAEDLRRLSSWAAVAALVTAALAFSGWAGPPAWLEALEAGGETVPTSPNTALGLAALALSQHLAAAAGRSRAARRTASVLVALVATVAGLTLLDNLLGHALRVDHWIAAPATLTCPRGAGHMSPITAAVLLLLCSGVFFRRRGNGDFAALIGAVGLLAGWSVVTGYLAGAEPFYGGPVIPVAPLTGAGIMLSSLALFASAGPGAWPLRLLADGSARAELLRGGVGWVVLIIVAFEVAVGVAFRVSGPLRALCFAGVILVATVIDLVLMVRVAGFVGAHLDRMFDERRRLHERLRYRRRLEAIGTFASGAAHEINNPLQQIMSSAELIAGAEPGDPHIPIQARAILEATQRAANVTHRLLAHASVDASAPAPVRPVDFLAQALALTATAFQRSGVIVTTSVPADLPPVSCRRGPLSQALVGLLVNAREALDARFPGADPRKQLDVSARALHVDVGEVVRVVLADRGCGIPEAIRERVFDPFFTTKTRDQGAGLGLWTAAAVVQELGGTISLESVEGEGTRVILDLPAGPREPLAQVDGGEILG